MSAAKAAAWRVSLATTPEQIGRCSSVMRELRPHIKAIDFAARVLIQQREGYQLAFLESDRGLPGEGRDCRWILPGGPLGGQVSVPPS